MSYWLIRRYVIFTQKLLRNNKMNLNKLKKLWIIVWLVNNIFIGFRKIEPIKEIDKLHLRQERKRKKKSPIKYKDIKKIESTILWGKKIKTKFK